MISAWTGKDAVLGSFRDTRGRLSIRRYPKEYSGFLPGPTPAGILEDYRILSIEGQKVLFRDYDARLEWLQLHADVPIMEADVSPVRRVIADNPDIQIEDPRWVAVDIETDTRAKLEDAIVGQARIVCIALHAPDGRTKQFVLQSDDDCAEEEMLRAYHDYLADYDLLIGWNSDAFDQLVLESRSKRYNIWPDRRVMWLDMMLVKQKFDVQNQESGETKSNALGNVAQYFLGYGKNDFDSSQIWDAYVAGGEDREEMLAYNRQDAKLIVDLDAVTGWLGAFFELCRACRVFPSSHNLKPSPQLDGYMLGLARERGIRLPTKIRRDGQIAKEFEGAYVQKPTKTVAENVHVCDFAALYPSIIRTLNLCYSTKDPNGTIVAPETGIRFRADADGMIPTALARFAEDREHWKKERKKYTPGTVEYKYADRRQMAPKLLSNSTYGVLANLHSRYFDVELAESVTATARWLLKMVISAAIARGWEAVYADTDSLMVTGCDTDTFAAFIRYCNELMFPEALRKQGCVKNFISLDFVETFSKIVFTAAKKYAGRFSRYAGQPVDGFAVEIKGLEYRRSDANRLERQMQEEAILMALGGWSYLGSVADFVMHWRNRIFNEPIPVDDVAISKGVKDDLTTYRTPSLPAQARVAEVLRGRGKRQFRVSYVITDASVSPQRVIPADDYTGVEADRFWLWNDKVYPSTMRVLVSAYPDTVDFHRFTAKRPKKALQGQMSLF